MLVGSAALQTCRARLLESLVSLQWAHLEVLVSPPPNQVIFKSNVLAMDKLCSGEMAPSPVTCASLSGYASIMSTGCGAAPFMDARH